MVSSRHSTEFLRLWSEHSRHIYAYIYSLVSNWSDADDIFQETSVVLIEKFDQFERGTNFTAWACRVAYLKTMESLRAHKLRHFVDESFLELVSDEIRRAPHEVEARFVALTECLKKLSAKDRKLIEMRYHGATDINAIAQRIKRSAKAIYKSLAHIHELLYDCVRNRLSEGEGP